MRAASAARNNCDHDAEAGTAGAFKLAGIQMTAWLVRATSASVQNI